MEYSEPELVVPALEILNLFEEGLLTGDLHALIRQELEPSGHDLELLEGRTDDRFSQKVRNLKSHDTLERKGLAKFEDGRFFITPDGRRYIGEFRAVFQAVSKQGFDIEKRKELAESDYQSLLIEEGAATNLSKTVYERSRKLTEHARSAFSDEKGRIVCVGCGFEGSSKYGDLGLGLIEIHHVKPLYLRDGKSERKQLDEALEGVAPLCPSCHRLVHRDLRSLMPIENLQKLTKVPGAVSLA